MNVRHCIELIATSTILIAVVGMIINRMRSGKGLGVKAIQFLAVATFAPLVLILALEGILDGGTVSALIGAFVGYLFSNIAEFDRTTRGSE